MDRYSGLINQEITLDFTYYKLGTPFTVYEITKVEIYDDYNQAVLGTSPLQTITDIDNIDIGKYQYLVSPLTTSGTYFDKIYIIENDGDPTVNYIGRFYVNSTITSTVGNPIQIDYPDPNPFQSINGVISYKSYNDEILLYSNFDVNTNAKYAIKNKTAITTGAPEITSGGVFGNYVNMNDATIKYDKCNFSNNYLTNTIDFKLRLDFDTAQTYQEFLLDSISANNLLSQDQQLNNILLYSSFNSSINATFAQGSSTATSYLGATYGPGGKFDNQLILSNNDARYITYLSEDNITLQSGSISFWVKPKYSGSPINNQVFLKIHNSIDNENKLEIKHKTTGQLNVVAYNSLGVIIFDQDFGTFTPNSTFLYNIELNFNINDGETRLFVDGNQLGSTQTSTGTRTDTLTIIQLGDQLLNNYFDIDEFVIYNEILHTTNFTPSNVELPQIIPYADDYEFKLKINNIYNNGGNDIIVNIDPLDSFSDIATKINNEITDSSCSINTTTGKIRIIADNIGHDVEIEEPTDGNSLVSLLEGVGEMTTPNAPVNDTILFQFYNGTNNNNRITFTHTNMGTLLLKMWDNSGTLIINNDFGIWSSYSNVFYNFALCFNKNIAILFIDGIKFGDTCELGFARTEGIDFIISGNLINDYGFDELIIYDNFKYLTDYTITITPITQYSTEQNYITLNYGTGISELSSILAEYTGTIRVIPIINGIGYWYSGGIWITSNMTYSQSSSITDFQNYFDGLSFDENTEFKVRVYIISDGVTNSYLNRLYLYFDSTEKPDYSEIIDWVKLKLGSPIIPLEITNSQIEANVYESLQRYLYFRNAKEDFTVMTLSGTGKSGYDIPEGWENFHDIVFFPNSPVSGLVYSGDWGKNIYLQYYYSLVSGGGGFMQGLLTDFYLTMSAMKDAQIILGYDPSYQILNGKLFIHPDPTSQIQVGLIKRRMPSIEEINNDLWIRRHVLALTKITIGEMRETIAQIPAGMENIPLNGAALKAEGIAERDKIEVEWFKLSEPLFLSFF